MATVYERVLATLAAAGENGIVPVELARAVAADPSSARRSVSQAVGRGLARREGTGTAIRVFITAEGAAAASGQDAAQPAPADAAGQSQPVSPAAAAQLPDNGKRLPDLDKAIAPLPPLLQAMIRWLLAAVVFRHHCRASRPDGHPGGILAGPTNVGKTVAAKVVARALGLDPAEVVIEPAKQPDGALWGRTVSQPGGKYAFQPAPLLASPFVCLDELGDATGARQVAALRLLQGRARETVDGQATDVACTVYATTNQPLADMAPSRRRRCLCADGTGLPPMTSLLAGAVLNAIPRLPWEHLAPPADSLPPAALADVSEALQACLSGGGLQLLDLRCVEAAALGYAALMGSADPAAGVVQAVSDYLLAAASTGTGGLPQPHPEPAAQQPGPDTAAAEISGGYDEKIAIVGVTGTMRRHVARTAADLAEAARYAPAALADAAGGVYDQLRVLHHDLRRIRSRSQLEEAAPVAMTVLGHADAIAGQARAYTAADAAEDAGELAGRVLDDERGRRLQQIGDAEAQGRRELPAGRMVGGFWFPGTQPAVPSARYRPPLQAAWNGSGAAVPPPIVIGQLISPQRQDTVSRAYGQAHERAADTTAGDWIAAESTRRAAAGEPPLTSAEMTGLALTGPPGMVP